MLINPYFVPPIGIFLTCPAFLTFWTPCATGGFHLLQSLKAQAVYLWNLLCHLFSDVGWAVHESSLVSLEKGRILLFPFLHRKYCLP